MLPGFPSGFISLSGVTSQLTHVGVSHIGIVRVAQSIFIIDYVLDTNLYRITFWRQFYLYVPNKDNFSNAATTGGAFLFPAVSILSCNTASAPVGLYSPSAVSSTLT